MAAAPLLSQFEQQYSAQTAEITAKIGRLATIANGSERRNAIKAIERSLQEVEDLLEQMELSVRELNAGTSERNKYELRVSTTAPKAEL